jgi:hypothetical protein
VRLKTSLPCGEKRTRLDASSKDGHHGNPTIRDGPRWSPGRIVSMRPALVEAALKIFNLF